jgi:4-hydroxy-tetrahydrodipicolinate synthase
MQFRGTFTALVTPFHEDGSLDEETLASLVQRQVAAGIDGLVPLGTTGETPTLDADERRRLLRCVREAAAGQAPLVVGVSANATKLAVENAREAAELGADALLVATPGYNKPTPNGIVEHFRAVAAATELPVMVYNIPGRTGCNITVPTMRRLAEIPGIAAVKEASGSLNQVAETILENPGLAVLSGDDALTLPLIRLGGCGVVSVASNLLPGTMNALVRAALDGAWEQARGLDRRLQPLLKALFIETNPLPVKAALAHFGLLKERYRLPLVPMEPANRAHLVEVLTALDPAWDGLGS